MNNGDQSAEISPEPSQTQTTGFQPESSLLPKKPKSKKTLYIVIGASGVIIIGAVVVFVWWLGYRNKGTSDYTGNQTISVQPDNPSTLSKPQKVMAIDGKHHFYYGAPAGQNNVKPKKIIISLPGHGTTAEIDYTSAWQKHIENGSWALASVGWWDGSGEQTQDYMAPAEVVTQTKAFLQQQGYDSNDLIVLEGFSRGSANTYAVIANDRISGNPVFDAVISASGGYQSDFPLTDEASNNAVSNTIFSGVYWVLACGGKDDNPNRDGCPAMGTTKTFLIEHGATVLGLLEDPNLGHGAFHLSTMNLPEQALQLISDKAQ